MLVPAAGPPEAGHAFVGATMIACRRTAPSAARRSSAAVRGRGGEAVDAAAPAVPPGGHGSGQRAADGLGGQQGARIAVDQAAQAGLVIGLTGLDLGQCPQRRPQGMGAPVPFQNVVTGPDLRVRRLGHAAR